MVALIKRISSTKIFPILWTLLTIGLLCLPGKVIPGLGLFGIKHLDKLAHIVLFGGFVLLWGLYSWQRKKLRFDWLFLLAGITVLSIILGIVMEYVQVNFVPNRSFDVWDIWADVVGSVLVMYLLIRFGRRLGLTV
jgi:VanZ family protein